MIGVLTALGQKVVDDFNRAFLYARCSSCGMMGCPPNDGHRYSCARPTCSGHYERVDPATLRAQFVWKDRS